MLCLLALVEEGEGLVVCCKTLVKLGLYLRLRSVGIGYGEDCINTIVRFALELLYLALTFYDKTNGYRLHTACRQSRFHLAPQYGRKLEAHNTVQNAACLLRIDKIHVKVSWMLYCRKDGRLCNLMEYDTVGRSLIQAQHLAQMPRNSLSLAVLIGCEPHLVCLLCALTQFLYKFFLVLRYDVCWLQRVLVYADFLLLKVAYVSV